MSALLRIWVVTDGRAGIEAQALGLAEAVSRLTPAHIALRRLEWPAWMRRLPTAVMPRSRRLLSRGAAGFAPPWPDLWIGNGRASIPMSVAVRRWSHGDAFVVQLQDPLCAVDRFDLVSPPNHDGLKGADVFPIIGTPHRVTPERLQAELAPFRPQVDALPHPRVVVLIGGRSKAFDLSPARADRLATQVGDAVRASGGAVLMTFSRRTPPAAEARMRSALADLPGQIWNGQGANPYFAFLAAADVILVTEDSANMLAEAAATGRPVYLLDMDGQQTRKQRFHAELAERGIARRFEGRLDTWTYAPLRETDRLAEEVLRRLEVRRARSA